MKLSLLLTFLVTTAAFAHDEVYEVDYLSDVDDATYREQTPRLYRGEGEHVCQSKEAIGHTCKNLGVNFTDCNHAFFKLEADDCCSGSKYGGSSISFKMTKCSNFN